MFKIQFLDHVAIRVKDPEYTVQWYEKVLGLKKWHPEEWKPYPIFLLAGETGIAVFPTKSKDPEPFPKGGFQIIDHFAFRVDQENFEQAQEYLNTLKIPFHFQDHRFFHSIYFKDPDGHQLELTTPIIGFN